MRTETEIDRRSVAFHEAAHAAVGLLFDHSPAVVTIKQGEQTEGHLRHEDGDIFSAEGARHLVMLCYAGAEAQRKLGDDGDTIKAAARGDNDEAEAYLPTTEKSEEELRRDTAAFLDKHWLLVHRIATELLNHETLDADEMQTLLAIYRDEETDEETDEDLAEYRERKARFLAAR